MDRIEYEEWALKGIDPALGPTPWSKVVEKKGAKEGKVSTSSRSRATDGDFGPGERFRVKERGNGALWDENRGREELVRASGAWRTFAHVGTAGLGRQLLPRKPPESQLTSAHPSPPLDLQVTLLYPPSLLSPGPLLDALKAQLAHREPHHRRAMWKCLLYVLFRHISQQHVEGAPH